MGTGGGAGGDGHGSVARCEALFLGAVGSGGCFGGCQRAGAELVPLGIAATQPWGDDLEGATTQTLRWGQEGHETTVAVTISLLPQNRGRHNERRHGGRAAGFDQEDPDLLHQRGPARARGLREPGGPLLPRRQPQQERAGGCRGRAPRSCCLQLPALGFSISFPAPPAPWGLAAPFQDHASSCIAPRTQAGDLGWSRAPFKASFSSREVQTPLLSLSPKLSALLNGTERRLPGPVRYFQLSFPLLTDLFPASSRPRESPPHSAWPWHVPLSLLALPALLPALLLGLSCYLGENEGFRSHPNPSVPPRDEHIGEPSGFWQLGVPGRASNPQRAGGSRGMLIKGC